MRQKMRVQTLKGQISIGNKGGMPTVTYSFKNRFIYKQRFTPFLNFKKARG